MCLLLDECVPPLVLDAVTQDIFTGMDHFCLVKEVQSKQDLTEGTRDRGFHGKRRSFAPLAEFSGSCPGAS